MENLGDGRYAMFAVEVVAQNTHSSPTRSLVRRVVWWVITGGSQYQCIHQVVGVDVISWALVQIFPSKSIREPGSGIV